MLEEINKINEESWRGFVQFALINCFVLMDGHNGPLVNQKNVKYNSYMACDN